MKGKLKEALDDKKDFEMEYLQLQKNFLRVKNAAPAKVSDEQADQQKPATAEDRKKLNQLIATQHKHDEEVNVLREDNSMLKRQNADLSEQYRELARSFDQN